MYLNRQGIYTGMVGKNINLQNINNKSKNEKGNVADVAFFKLGKNCGCSCRIDEQKCRGSQRKSALRSNSCKHSASTKVLSDEIKSLCAG